MMDGNPELRSRSSYTKEDSIVLAAERAELELETEEDVLGLALSGGGIRSASFALGVIQALIGRDCLMQFHYLSTVSGGGYMGIALNWLRARHGMKYPEQLSRRSSGARPMPSAKIADASEGRRGVWLDYLRLHGRYLLPNSFGGMALVGVALRSIVVSLFVYGGTAYLALLALLSTGSLTASNADGLKAPTALVSIPLLLLVLAAVVGVGALHSSWSTWVASLSTRWRQGAGLAFTTLTGLVAIAGCFALSSDGVSLNFGDLSFRLVVACILAALLWTLVGVGYLRLERRRKAKRADNAQPAAVPFDSDYQIRIIQQKRLGDCLSIICGLAVIQCLPWIHYWVQTQGAAALTSFGTLGAMYQFMRGRSESAISGKLAKLRILTTTALLLLGLLVLAYALAMTTYSRANDFAFWPYALLLLIAILLTGGCTNLNLFGIGRMYRDRLMETFTPDDEAVRDNTWRQAFKADGPQGQLRTVWQEARHTGRRLYPLINSLVVLMDSAADKYRGRGGDSFVMTPLYCGSNATGYVKTEHFADGALQAATAMAISGAAVNPRTGAGGQGISRNRLVSFLMFILQFRLGAWVRNPAANAIETSQKKIIHRWLERLVKQRPNFVHPGVVNGLLGRRMRESSYFVELTDGGHFDNTGVYELIRRRCRLILLSQASADPRYEMQDLGTLIERVRVDFGVHLRFSTDFPLSALLPRATPERAASDQLYAQRGFAMAEVLYPAVNGEGWDIGVLILVQATPTEAVPADIHAYYNRTPDFPNETTGDQFFDEAQVEAYRELGYANAKQALSLIESASATETAQIERSDLATLARSLLQPKARQLDSLARAAPVSSESTRSRR